MGIKENFLNSPQMYMLDNDIEHLKIQHTHTQHIYLQHTTHIFTAHKCHTYTPPHTRTGVDPGFSKGGC